MRRARLRMDQHDTFYHCYNRVAGTAQDRPFTAIEKEQFIRILRRVSQLYVIDVIAFQVMSNHYHLLLRAPKDKPSDEEICRRFKEFHRGKRHLITGSTACKTWRARSRDISWFMRHVQQLFTVWYNGSRPVKRRGKLWADRFKNTLLESGSAVWSCWVYIENNPVRAGLVERAGQYRFGSHGRWCQSGRPFSTESLRRILPMLANLFGIRRLEDVLSAMSKALHGSSEHRLLSVIDRRVKFWTEGWAIGSRLYIESVIHQHRHRHRRIRPPQPVSTSDITLLHAWNATALVADAASP